MAVLDSITSVARQFLGTTNEAVLRRIWPVVRKVTALEARMQGLDDVALKALAAELRQRVTTGKATLEDVAVEALALVREAADRRIGMWNAFDPAKGFPDGRVGQPPVRRDRSARQARRRHRAVGSGTARRAVCPDPYPPSGFRAALPHARPRRADPRCFGAASGQDLGNAYRRRQDAGRQLCRLPERPHRSGRAHRHRQRLPGGPRCQLERPDPAFPGRVHRRHPEPDAAAPAQAHLRLRRGVRHQFRVRLRLPARQPRPFPGRAGAAPPHLRHRRRGRLDPGRRGPRAADHQRPGDEPRGQLQAGQRRGQADGQGRGFHRRYQGSHHHLDRRGHRQGGQAVRRAQPLRRRGHALAALPGQRPQSHHLFLRDKEYLVSSGQVRIVDEHTGRVLEGRRWSDGLHQAVEAKEGVEIREENQTYATITLQNFFRLYGKLAGMTGTAMTEANEFNAIYKLEVVAIPPNRPVVRNDLADLIFGTEKEKFDAIVKEVEELHALGQPVLVGTISVEVSERMSEHFTRKGVRHNVLNARQHQREAEIVLGAGQFAAVTIATNMAGRGTDIVLGKTDAAAAFKHWQAHDLMPKKLKPDSRDAEIDEAAIDLWVSRWMDDKSAEKIKGQSVAQKLAALNKARKLAGFHPLPLPSVFKSGVDVRQLGGLRIIGSERHDSRRIDNQLRGRSGRQGDPGSSRFYLSLEDDLMKRFAGPTMANLMRSMGLKDGQAIESPMVSRQVEKAQKKVEEYHYGVRKNLLEYDQVANGQRTLIYRQRQAIIEGKDCDKTLLALYRESLDGIIQTAAADGTRGEELAKRISGNFAEEYGLPALESADIPVKDGGEACLAKLMPIIERGMEQRRTDLGEVFDHMLRFVMLETIDRRWKDHLYSMDHLRHAIGLEGYAQKDPRMRYKEEGYRQFAQMNELIRQDVVRLFFRLQVQTPNAEPETVPQHLEAGGFMPKGAVAAAGNDIETTELTKPGLNDPCPCGSGKPFKRCHGG